MTEPKPTRFLSARLREYAEGWGQMLRDLVEHPALDNDVPEEEDARLAVEYDRARGYGRPLGEQARDAYEDAEDSPIVRWTKGQKTLPEFVECDGKCITAAEVGVPEAGGMYAVDPECTLHGKVLPVLEATRRRIEERGAE